MSNSNISSDTNNNTDADSDNDERLRRWRLMLGGSSDGTGASLSGTDVAMDAALAALYGKGGATRRSKAGDERYGGSEASMPNVARWLGDIREYFPASVVRVMQQDAIDRLGLRQFLFEPEILETLDADVHLVADLMALKNLVPNQTRATARLVVQKVVNELIRKLTNPTRQAIMGALNRSTRNRRPRLREIDWNRTIRANLRHYQADYHTIIPETLIGYGRRRSALRDVILCVDQSGSMATSVVYASIFAAVLGSLPAMHTQIVVFDTAVVDLTPMLSDPVELLFGTQLGGGTNIARALAYCQQLIRRPQETIFVLITDLYEGGNRADLISRAESIVASGVQLITLLALNDDGAPSYEGSTAAAFAKLGSPAFACTPDLFPDLMAAAIRRDDLSNWAASHDLRVKRA